MNSSNATSAPFTSFQEAKRFMIDCFKAAGANEKNAEIAAEVLLIADRRGHPSHGMNRLSWYINDIERGLLDPNGQPKIDKETPATALVDGSNSLGAVVGRFCMNLAMEKAKTMGVGLVSAHNSNHYGMAAVYVMQAMEQGLIGFTATNTSPLSVPTRAKQSALGTNPLALGACGTNNDSFILDMATTTVAVGKIEIKKRRNESILHGWALDNNGHVTLDPIEALKAKKLLPLGGVEDSGGYKGFGLQTMVEILSGILSGSKYGPYIPVWGGEKEENADLGQIFIAINPKMFAGCFENRVHDLMEYFRQMEPMEPDKPVLAPGDPEVINMKINDARGGVFYVENQHKTNLELANRLKIPPMKSIDKVQSKI